MAPKSGFDSIPGRIFAAQSPSVLNPEFQMLFAPRFQSTVYPRSFVTHVLMTTGSHATTDWPPVFDSGVFLIVSGEAVTDSIPGDGASTVLLCIELATGNLLAPRVVSDRAAQFCRFVSFAGLENWIEKPRFL